MAETTGREAIERAFARVRAGAGVREGFPPEVVEAAEGAAERDPAGDPGRADRRDVPLVTIDPPGSRDLDQALWIGREGEGLRLRYAIADVGFFVDRGGPVEREAWLRGVTVYAPDRRAPLYPPVLSRGAASLLPERDRPAVLFDLLLDARAEPVEVRVERARVRSRAQLTYGGVQARVSGGAPPAEGEEREWAEWLPLLREFGELRRAREAERGGASLPILDQHVQADAAERLGYALEYETPVPSEEWNAQVSLLTGHVAARRMLRAGVGLLRTLPPADPDRVRRFRTAARAMGFDWPEGRTYADFLRALDPAAPRVPGLVWQARGTMRGAGYAAFSEEPPKHPEHAALAMVYAHATAPLRRLADRYVLDLLVTLERGGRPTPAEVETLHDLPGVMEAAQRRASLVERRGVDVAEAWTLRGREGETFAAVALGERRGEVEVQLADPAVRALASTSGGEVPAPGEPVRVRLVSADVEEGRVRFAVA